MLDSMARSAQHSWSPQQLQQQLPAAASLQEAAFLQKLATVKHEAAAHPSKYSFTAPAAAAVQAAAILQALSSRTRSNAWTRLCS
jgi:hypothetical protein